MADVLSERSITRTRAWGLVVGGVIVALLLIGVGIVIGRAGNESSTTATGDPQAVVAKSGPTRVENGVPVGYPQSEEGVVQATINYWRALAKPMGGDADDFRAAVETISSDRYRDVALREYVADNDPGGNVFPAAYKIVSSSETAATVKLWSVGLLPSEQGNPQQVWTLGTVELVWENGDWKVDGLAAEVGPTPPSVVESDNPSAFDILDTYTRIDYEPASQP